MTKISISVKHLVNRLNDLRKTQVLMVKTISTNGQFNLYSPGLMKPLSQVHDKETPYFVNRYEIIIDKDSPTLSLTFILTGLYHEVLSPLNTGDPVNQDILTEFLSLCKNLEDRFKISLDIFTSICESYLE